MGRQRREREGIDSTTIKKKKASLKGQEI